MLFWAVEYVAQFSGVDLAAEKRLGRSKGKSIAAGALNKL
jgi:hypothetical protein